MLLWAARILSLACGLLMAASAGFGAPGPARPAIVLSVAAVLAGTIFRPAATVGVVLTVVVIALANPAAGPVAMSGLFAALYLVLRHATVNRAGMEGLSGPVLAAGGFAFAGLIAAAFPLQVPWLPLVAPLAVVAIYLLATWPFLGDRPDVGDRDPRSPHRS
ncbi:hypothetical protein [Mycobacterium sp.]|uniref:hypothetical protein n=1 Tax=Mycobacterium sp. TaxID=1785 RepID=UPI001283755D|nr:hypothetical protein [Mycobacterium sp.]KAA8960872.1 MAG: hypothetical protein F6Q13_13170 [Mycobacterium sp.]